MISILIVGAGQIGSRHLQSLGQIDRAASITAVEPSMEAQRVARQRFQEAGASRLPDLRFVAELPSGEFDFAVVATSADVRRRVVEVLLQRAAVRYLLLEKVLFQRLEDYDAIGNLLERRGVPAWVNCAQRLWRLFQDARRAYKEQGPVELHVSGAQWGLGCNAIHNLDFLPYLTGDTGMRLDARLDPGTVPAKRPGFVEFTGVLEAQDRFGNRVVQTSSRQGDALFHMEVRNRAGVLSLADGAAPRQSGLTHGVVQTVLDTGRCDLPPYAQSAAVHREMLKVFLSHLAAQGETGDTCPIT